MSRNKITDADQNDSGVLTCLSAAGRRSRPKRSLTSKVVTVATVGIGALVVPKRWVIGRATYKRG